MIRDILHLIYSLHVEVFNSQKLSGLINFSQLVSLMHTMLEVPKCNCFPILK
jgi:hypothetical protein